MTPPPFLKLTFGRGGIRPLPLLRPRAVPGEEPLPPPPRALHAPNAGE